MEVSLAATHWLGGTWADGLRRAGASFSGDREEWEFRYCL